MSKGTNQDTNLFRFVVLAILIFIFIGVATNKIWELRVTAERVGVIHTLGSLQSALGIKLSKEIIHNGVQQLNALHLSNPMQLWTPPPLNYKGEFKSSNAPNENGIWYFDSESRELIYRVRFTDYFISDDEIEPSLARYQLKLEYQDKNSNQQYDPYEDRATGLRLLPVGNYQWLMKTGLSMNGSNQ